MKKLVIFSFDGTLADTSPGILYCFNTTAAAMGYAPVDHDALRSVIGITLEQGFKKLYNMSDDELEYASNNYSKLYSQKGKEMFTMYHGMKDALRTLKNKGCLLAIATQKHAMYTADILKFSGIDDLFDTVCATDVNTNLTKSSQLAKACEQIGVSVNDSIFVGDSEVDAEGAKKSGMDFAAVLYGLGFKTVSDTEKYSCRAVIVSPDNIVETICSID